MRGVRTGLKLKVDDLPVLLPEVLTKKNSTRTGHENL